MMPKMKAESRIYKVQLDPPRQRDTLRDLQQNSNSSKIQKYHLVDNTLIVVFQLLGSGQLCDPWTAAHPVSLSFTSSQSLLKFMSIESAMPSSLSSHHTLLLLPSVFPSIRVFTKMPVLHIRCPKCWTFGFSISPSREYSGLISFRIDWFDLLVVQGTIQSLLQHSSSKASIPWHSALSPTLLSIHEYWINHSFDLTDLCRQSNVCFLKSCLGWS